MFYVWKVLIILLFLIFSSWMPLFQPAEDFGSRFSESLTLLLAAVAFLFVVNDSLPRISYLTVLDKAMLICFGAIFFIGLESFVVYLLVKPPSSSRSRSVAKIVDTHMRWIYPLLFIFAQSIVAWNAVNRRAKLISDPEAQWQLVAASGDSKLKEMPPTDDANDDHRRPANDHRDPPTTDDQRLMIGQPRECLLLAGGAPTFGFLCQGSPLLAGLAPSWPP